MIFNSTLLGDLHSSSEDEAGIKKTSQPGPGHLGWELIPEGSRRRTKDGKKNDVLRGPDGRHYTRHHSQWQCTQTLTNTKTKKRCSKKVLESLNPQGDVIYEYDPKTVHEHD